MEPLAEAATITPLSPNWNPDLLLAPAVTDELNEPLSAEEQENFLNDTFVNVNGLASYRDSMREALQQTAQAASYEMYGFPADDRQLSCLNDGKLDLYVSFRVLTWALSSTPEP
jgi:hypothetical protein